MNVVVDTSVFVAALLGSGQGPSREILRACLTGKLKPLMGTALFHEYESLAARDGLYEQSPLTSGERERLLDAFFSVCNWITIYFAWRPNLPDEADNHLIELAVAGAAEVVVTNNVRDLRSSELHFPGLRILTPPELLQEIR